MWVLQGWESPVQVGAATKEVARYYNAAIAYLWHSSETSWSHSYWGSEKWLTHIGDQRKKVG
ncbi:hypothetical protein L195_g036249 [Trifolium pratense]|uniref:Uncharacterized protein n=1 Tax=Trifolium pratense TaxID=57577 RepID=A0A2K3LNZ1_TRIPR|nr:hypothetical protein L195_g036249 [Trifolium pratense]